VGAQAWIGKDPGLRRWRHAAPDADVEGSVGLHVFIPVEIQSGGLVLKMRDVGYLGLGES
jgi:hypothetical protein